MLMERDFTYSEINKYKMYGGKNGSKVCIVYQGEDYMLKFPPSSKRNQEMSYTNGCISEYISCHVFDSLGIAVQETMLGTYRGKTVVACKDMTGGGFVLMDFAQLKNTIIDSENNGYGTELSDILATIEEQQIVSPVELKEQFWNIFIADALLGNFDRHNGNWGFLVNSITHEAKIAPVFDCGSCLYPAIHEELMKTVMVDTEELRKRLFDFPSSAIRTNKVKISYADFLMSTDNEDCLKSLRTIGTRIDMSKIESIVEDAPYVSGIHKHFLKFIIKERKEQIIDMALKYDKSNCKKQLT
jgi:hypothetical protein